MREAMQHAPSPAEEHIASEALRHRGQFRMPCPFCSAQRKKANQRAPVLSVRNEGDRAVYFCWHCGEEGVVKFDRGHHTVRTTNTIVRKPEPEIVSEFERAPLTTSQVEMLTKRGINRATAEALGAFAIDKWITSVGEVVECIGFPYLNKGVAYAAKVRAVATKGFASLGAPATFWGLDHYTQGEDFLIVEGEFDVLAMREAGVTAVSVPSGAPLKVRDGAIDPSEDGKFRYVWSAKDQIDAAKRVIIAVDNDSQGDALAEELARRIGKARCWRLHWPSGIKDANDYWLSQLEACSSHEEAAAQFQAYLTSNIHPWPVAGLEEADKFFGDVDTLYRDGLPPGESTGWQNVDEIVTIQRGLVYIVTGIPGHGKSSWLDNVLVHLAEQRNWRVGLASFENPQAIHISKLCAIHVRKPFGKGPSARMSADELEAAKKWTKGHFYFLTQDGVLPTVDSIIERLATAVMRYGIRAAIIDPWNFINLGETFGENGTEAINQALSRLKVFAQAHGVALFLVVHPAKPPQQQGGKDFIPTGYSLSGSAHFYNRTDFGITVYRKPKAPSQIIVWKCRFNHLGKMGEALLNYDPATGRFIEEREPWDQLEDE